MERRFIEEAFPIKEISQSCLREKTLNHIIHHLENY